MASFDRQFEVIMPSLDRLVRKPLEVADTRLLDPTNSAVVPLIDGELVQVNASYQWARGSSTSSPAHFTIEDRGDYGVQASRKLSAILLGGFEADTVVFDSGVTTLGAPLMLGTVNDALSGSVNRAGLIAHTSTNVVIGYVMRPHASNNNKLRFLQVAV